MHRINTLEESAWDYACPPPEKHRSIRVIDGHFECRQCGPVEQILHLPSGELLSREDVEIVGPHADHQAAYDPREV